MSHDAGVPAVRAAGVVVRYPSPGAESADAVLRGVDLTVQRGESVAVVGPSGCGKSTLLHVLGGLLPPQEGVVEVDGQPLADRDAAELAALRRRSVGFVFQEHHLLPQCSALENVLVPLLAEQSRVPPEAIDRGRALLAQVGLSARETHRPSELSGGECQRVAVVRALMARPALLLADEPTGSLDEAGAEALAEVIIALVQTAGAGLVTVTHSPLLAGRMQRTLRLHGGVLAAATASS